MRAASSAVRRGRTYLARPQTVTARQLGDEIKQARAKLASWQLQLAVFFFLLLLILPLLRRAGPVHHDAIRSEFASGGLSSLTCACLRWISWSLKVPRRSTASSRSFT
jgi:hypothetical protein